MARLFVSVLVVLAAHSAHAFLPMAPVGLRAASSSRVSPRGGRVGLRMSVETKPEVALDPEQVLSHPCPLPQCGPGGCSADESQRTVS